MSRLPPTTGARVVQALERHGFLAVRRRGSHVVLQHLDGRTTVVPVYAGEPLGPGLLPKIARDVGASRTEFLKMLAD